MCRVGRVRGQDDFGIRRHVDFASPASHVGDRDTTCLGIVFGRDGHVQPGGDRAIAPDDFDAILEERRLVTIGFDSTGLVARRPHGAAVGIAKEDVRTPAIACRVLVPAGHREMTPAAVSRPRRGHHHGVPAVGEQLRVDDGLMRRLEAARRRRDEFMDMGGRLYLVASRMGGFHIARRAFLQ